MWYWGATGLSHQLFKKLAREFGTVCIRVNTAKEAILLHDKNTLVKVYSDNTPLQSVVLGGHRFITPVLQIIGQ